jgi:hypothetical protein
MPQQLSDPPPGLLKTLANIDEALTAQVDRVEITSLALGAGLEREVMVPLAAFLLEYPVAYVPTPNETSFLAGVCLDVYDCTLIRSHHVTENVLLQDHSFLTFSSPHQLGSENLDLSPPSLLRKLNTRYRSRLREITSNCALETHHRTESFDRVAL